MGNCNGGGYYPGPGVINNPCPDKFGCYPGLCPDIELKRFDTIPPFTLSVSDCSGPLDLTNTVVEVNMWAQAKIKSNVLSTSNTIQFADEIGFYQVFVGDIIQVNNVRSPELLLVSEINEATKTLTVIRGYRNTVARDLAKGTKVKIFRILNAMGSTSIVRENIDQLDGSIKNVITDSRLIYNWKSGDTCLPGCYFLEFKLLKILLLEDTFIPSVVSFCDLGQGVEWARRFPVDSQGFVVKIHDTPTSEFLAGV